MTDGLNELVKAGLRNPVRVVVKVEDVETRKVQRTPSSLSIRYVTYSLVEKFQLLLALLDKNSDKKVIVYFCTCFAVDYFFKVGWLVD